MDAKKFFLFLYILATISGAFLLFQIQPVIAKYILSWFGGIPSVWTVCMLFFQIVLLFGYGYAYLLSKFLRPDSQAMIHILVLGIAWFCLPVSPEAYRHWATSDTPTLSILLFLSFSIGFPYFILSSTSPLIQSWFALTNPGPSPYRLYAFSNVGSLLALITYPFLFEPLLFLTTQTTLWSWGMRIFILFYIFLSLPLMKKGKAIPIVLDCKSSGSGNFFLWLGFPCLSVILLLSFTNKICEEIAVIPFLWILPLSLYLLSFILCFDKPKWYSRRIYGIAFITMSLGICLIHFLFSYISLFFQVVVYSCALFSGCMACHGELVRLKPSPKHLTLFYLTISLGGSMGGILVAIIAPLFFMDYWEFPLGILATLLLLFVVFFQDRNSPLSKGKNRRAWAFLITAFGIIFMAFYFYHARFLPNTLQKIRNFYGIVSVYEFSTETEPYHVMQHGIVTHGIQAKNLPYRLQPASYFSEKSGIGKAFHFLETKNNRHIGILGLGIGSLAGYAKKGDRFRFYEINPVVRDIACGPHFTYLAETKAQVEIVLGDGRISLEKEKNQQFDLLVMDAFSGGTIPVHLLTKEAFEIYFQHLQEDGIIAINISNRHFDFMPVVYSIAIHFKKECIFIEDIPSTYSQNTLLKHSLWCLIHKNRHFSEKLSAQKIKKNFLERSFPIWTDNYVSLLKILK